MRQTDLAVFGEVFCCGYAIMVSRFSREWSCQRPLRQENGGFEAAAAPAQAEDFPRRTLWGKIQGAFESHG
ncbi:MAG: hypothetical protein AVO33_00070 [delta proteobacterium ML8_F1]|nr:MAG: hypothetical protein AVO33_00070 [delta proteobacterium ML8_F1]